MSWRVQGWGSWLCKDGALGLVPKVETFWHLRMMKSFFRDLKITNWWNLYSKMTQPLHQYNHCTMRWGPTSWHHYCMIHCTMRWGPTSWHHYCKSLYYIQRHCTMRWGPTSWHHYCKSLYYIQSHCTMRWGSTSWHHYCSIK